MPVRQCPNGKWRIGDGPCMYESKESATRAYVAYLAQHSGESQHQRFDADELKRKLELERKK